MRLFDRQPGDPVIPSVGFVIAETIAEAPTKNGALERGTGTKISDVVVIGLAFAIVGFLLGKDLRLDDEANFAMGGVSLLLGAYLRKYVLDSFAIFVFGSAPIWLIWLFRYYKSHH